jgi:hypothetical protein
VETTTSFLYPRLDMDFIPHNEHLAPGGECDDTIWTVEAEGDGSNFKPL